MLEESNMSFPSLPSSVLNHACLNLLVFTVHVLRSLDYSKGKIFYFTVGCLCPETLDFATSENIVSFIPKMFVFFPMDFFKPQVAKTSPVG